MIHLSRQEVDDGQFLHVINKRWTDHCEQMVRRGEREGGREGGRVGGWVGVWVGGRAGGWVGVWEGGRGGKGGREVRLILLELSG